MITISRADLHDLETIQMLNTLLFEQQKDAHDDALDIHWPFSGEGEQYFRDCIEGHDACVFLAYSDDDAVGYLAGGIVSCESYRHPIRMAELQNMFIQSEYRGQGVGKQLSGAFLDWCKEQGIERVKVEAYAANENAIHLYRAMGFEDYALILEKTL